MSAILLAIGEGTLSGEDGSFFALTKVKICKGGFLFFSPTGVLGTSLVALCRHRSFGRWLTGTGVVSYYGR